MIPLADWDLSRGAEKHRIELYCGDLSYLPAEHAVDVLVVSAFRNDYVPTPSSLIGALKRNGISVYALSFAKSYDMREEFGCWLSQPVGVSSFKRILCVESGWRGSPPEQADDLFRALAPATLMNVPAKHVAMPLIGAGDQGHGAGEMLEAVLRAAIGWLRRGLPIEVLKIVAYSMEAAAQAKERFLEIKEADAAKEQEDSDWDVFLSYSSSDAPAANQIQRSLSEARTGIRVFRDRESLEQGASWLMQVAHAIDSARCVLALYTPKYWDSVVCKDELSAAYVRQAKTANKILYPIYYRDASIPSFFEALHFKDCREANPEKLAEACRGICAALPAAV